MTPRLVWGERDAIGPLMLGAALAAYVALGAWVSCTTPPLTPEHTASVAAYGVELAACRAKAKADSGTYAEYEACACQVDRRYGVDAGGCP